MRIVLPLLLLFASLPVSAVTLDEIRSSVRRFSAKEPVHATLTIEQQVVSSGKFANDRTARSASAEVGHDAAGVSITIPQALLDRAAQERGRDRADATTRDAIQTFQPDTVIETLDFHEPLLRMLEGAVVHGSSRANWSGRPAHRLVLELHPPAEKHADRIQIGTSKTDDILTLWLDDSLVPLAADRDQKTTAGILFLKGTVEWKVSYRFLVQRDRILVARSESTFAGSGAGQKVDKHVVQTLAVR